MHYRSRWIVKLSKIEQAVKVPDRTKWYHIFGILWQNSNFSRLVCGLVGAKCNKILCWTTFSEHYLVCCFPKKISINVKQAGVDISNRVPFFVGPLHFNFWTWWIRGNDQHWIDGFFKRVQNMGFDYNVIKSWKFQLQNSIKYPAKEGTLKIQLWRTSWMIQIFINPWNIWISIIPWNIQT